MTAPSLTPPAPVPDTRRLSPALLLGGAVAMTTVANLLFQVADILFTDKDPRRAEGPVQSLKGISVIAAVALAVALAVAITSSREASRARTGAMLLGGLSILTVPIFWSGAPAIFGACAAWLGGLTRGSHPQQGAARALGLTGAVVAVLSVVATWGGYIATSSARPDRDQAGARHAAGDITCPPVHCVDEARRTAGPHSPHCPEGIAVRVLMSTTSGAGIPAAPADRLRAGPGRARGGVRCSRRSAGDGRARGTAAPDLRRVAPDDPERAAAFAQVPLLPPDGGPAHRVRRVRSAQHHCRAARCAGRGGAVHPGPRAARGSGARRPPGRRGRRGTRGRGHAVLVDPRVPALDRGGRGGPARVARSADRDEDGGTLLQGPTASWFPASFDLPEAPAHVQRFRDPSLPTPTPVHARSVVYVTLGTEAPNLPFFEHVLAQLVRGAARAGSPVVVATGRHVDPGLLTGTDGDIRVDAWVDQAEVLGTARVVVCHAGSGTVLGALAAQVPIVAVPLFADQPDNAGRLVATRCGLQVPPDADSIAAATRDLATRLPDGCVPMGQELAALPPAEAAVPWLEALAARPSS